MTSQKAESLEQYQEGYDNWTFERQFTPLRLKRIDMSDKYDVAYFKQQAEEVWESFNGDEYDDDKTLFIRACPLTARHGVLESSPASSLKECINIVRRIGRTMLGPNPHDPEGEPIMEPNGCIIVQEYIAANASAVLNPDMHLHIAGGIDGITAGTTGTSIAIPMDIESWETTMYNLLGFDDHNKLQLEFVSKLRTNDHNTDTPLDMMRYKHINHNSYITQFRATDGNVPITPPPKGVTINGFIPSKGRCISREGVSNVVNDIYFLDTDVDQIAAMEAFMKKGWDDGTVVSHPSGTTSSHAAMECMKFDVPYIVAAVEKGQVWTQAAAGWVTSDKGYEPQPYDAYDHIESFMEGLSVGLYHWARQYGWLSTQFHQINAPIHNPDETTFLAGAFVGWLVNGMAATGLGEMRHAKSRRRNTTPNVYATLSAVYNSEWLDVSRPNGNYPTTALPSDRQNFYYTMEENPMTLETLKYTFTWLDKMFKQNWSGGYGGTKYAESCNKGKELVQSIMGLVKNINRDNFLDVLSKANTAEHAVHNNGYFFNKFMSKVSFDMGTRGRWRTCHLSQTFNVFYAADAALSKRRAEIPNLQDSVDILKYSCKHSYTYWRKNPIALDTKAPYELKNAIIELHTEDKGWFLHSGNGDYTDQYNSKFVPCGYGGCGKCKEWVENLEAIKLNDAKSALAHSLGVNPIDFVDTGIEYDMWESNTISSEIEPWMLTAVDSIHESNYEYGVVSLGDLALLFKSTTPDMSIHKSVMKILTKYCHMNMDKMIEEHDGASKKPKLTITGE